MAEFMTQKFITSTQNDQLAIMKAIDYAIIERYGTPCKAYRFALTHKHY